MSFSSAISNLVFRARDLVLVGIVAVSLTAQAQTVYATGAPSALSSGTNALSSVNVSTGVATKICDLPFSSAALAMNPADGLAYFIEITVASPRLAKINPVGCATSAALPTSLPAGIIRATFCPDGRFYASTHSNQLYEINPATGATLKTLNIPALPTTGSGDFACTSNGQLYVVAPSSNLVSLYSLYRINAVDLQAAADLGTVNAVTVGALGRLGTPNGLTEADSGAAGCGGTNPCLVASVNAIANQLWTVNSASGATTIIGNSGLALSDLARTFPVDVKVEKASIMGSALQGQTLTYGLLVSNIGSAIANSTVTDVFSPAMFASTVWQCVVAVPGAASVSPTACGATSGSGNINNPVALSPGGSVVYLVTATLASGFTGAATNVARATVSSLITDSDPSNNVSALVSTPVTPAALLTITKTNGTNSLVAGQTTSYTVTVANLGPGAAPGARVIDLPGAGLQCTALACSASGGASCPSSLSVSALASPGLLLPAFPVGSAVRFVVTCGVTASGY